MFGGEFMRMIFDPVLQNFQSCSSVRCASGEFGGQADVWSSSPRSRGEQFFFEVWLEDVICQRFLCWGISLKATIPHRHIFPNCSYYILGRYIKLSRRGSERLFLSAKHTTWKETHCHCTLHNKPVKVFRELLTRRVTLPNFSLLNTMQVFAKGRDVSR